MPALQIATAERTTSPPRPTYDYTHRAGDDSIPAGYATTYTVNDATEDVGEFAFITIRLAGHMVPAFQPRAAASFFETWIAGGTF
jgi:carboxypeptidase C (cathepsin A)